MEVNFLQVNIRKVGQISFCYLPSVQSMICLTKAGGGVLVRDVLFSLNTHEVASANIDSDIDQLSDGDETSLY